MALLDGRYGVAAQTVHQHHVQASSTSSSSPHAIARGDADADEPAGPAQSESIR
jgi:hypothetical protein